jgi:hypothetical protein
LDHLSDECDFIAVETNGSAIPRLYAKSIDLYQLTNPRFYPGPSEDIVATCCHQDHQNSYQVIAISRAVEFLCSSSSTCSHSLTHHQQLSLVDQIAQPFHSTVFPLDFTSFRDQVLTDWVNNEAQDN